MVKKELATRKKEKRGRSDKNQVRWVARMDDILHALLAEHLEQKAKFMIKRTQIFLEVVQSSFRFRQWMAIILIPSNSSYSKGYFLVFGQITETSAPASWSDVASCQTRRSKGTGRFSTTIQTFLPDNSFDDRSILVYQQKPS